MRRRCPPALLAAAAVAVVASLTAACGDDDAATTSGPATSSAPDRVTITISDFAFEPRSVRVASGGEVTVSNADGLAHTATATGTFDTGSIAGGGQASVTAPGPGTYRFFCAFHPYMEAALVVG